MDQSATTMATTIKSKAAVVDDEELHPSVASDEDEEQEQKSQAQKSEAKKKKKAKK